MNNENQIYSSQEGCDAIILSVLPASELQSVLRVFGRDPKEREDWMKGGDRYWKIDIDSPRAKRRLRILVTSLGEAGNPGAAARAASLIADHNPGALFLCGIAAGLKGKVNLGDVVIGDEVIGYEGERREEKSSLKRPQQIQAPYAIRQDLRHFMAEASRFRECFKMMWNQTSVSQFQESSALTETFTPDIQLAIIASGEKLLADGSLASMREGIHEKIRAGEMEGIGLATACHNRSPEVPFALFRGVSDFGDVDKGDSWHQVASIAAACALRAFLETEYNPPDAPAMLQKDSVQTNKAESSQTSLLVTTDIDLSSPTAADIKSGALRSWFIRLKVANHGDSLVANCVGRLLKVLDEQGNHLKQYDSLDLYWSRQDSPEVYQPVSIQGKGDFHYLDVAQIKEAQNVLTLRVVVPKGHRLVTGPGHIGSPNDLLPGTYYMLIGIFSESASLEPSWFKIRWESDYSSGQPCSVEPIIPGQIEELIRNKDAIQQGYGGDETDAMGKLKQTAETPIAEAAHPLKKTPEKPIAQAGYIVPASQEEVMESRKEAFAINIPLFLDEIKAIGEEAKKTKNSELALERFYRLGLKIERFLVDTISDKERKRFITKAYKTWGVIYRDPIKDLYENHLKPAHNYLIALAEAVERSDEDLLF